MLKNIYFYIFISNAVNLRRDISTLYNRVAMFLCNCILNGIFSLVTTVIGLHGDLSLNTIPNFNTQTINQNRKFSSIELYNNMESKSSKFTGLIDNSLDPEFVIIKGSTERPQLILSKNFIEWFRGFTDAEGCFIIQSVVHLTKDHNFKFIFRITLHLDDLACLEFIKNTLHIGNVRVNVERSEVVYEVSAQREIEIILAIFNKFNLNTTKHLNFIAFEQAFLLFVENNSQEARKELKSKIKFIKDNMNRQRTDFTMPLNHYNISNYWLLGFVEGEGSFYFSASNKSIVFSISQKGNETLMLAIQEFLYNLVPLEQLNSVIDDENWVKINSDSRGIFNLIVQRRSYIEFVLIPFFDSITWRSKKFLDYKDWKAIFYLYNKGFNYLQEGEALIKRILSQMNNNRLSTSKGSSATKVDRDLLQVDLDKLLSESSNYEIKEGRIFIKSLNRFKGSPTSKMVQLLDVTSGNIISTFSSIAESAKFLGALPQTTRIRVQKNTHFLFKGKLVYLKFVE